MTLTKRLKLKRPILMLAVAVLTAAPVHAVEYTAEQYKKAVWPCWRSADYECVEKNWQQYLRLRPTDTNAIANLGIVRNLRDNHQGAIIQFERAIDLGEGTYDMFAYYADSLAKVGRTEDAIDWSYKTLAVVPKLVDVRGKLAKLLVLQKRYHEALALLISFDEQLGTKGESAYFEGQRIAIETAIARNSSAPSVEMASLRLPKYGDHFFAPIVLGESRPLAFMVDTGASRLTLSDDYLAKSKANYKVTGASVGMRTADGRRVVGRTVTIDLLRVGPYVMKNVPVFACKDCELLLGQSALSKFDLKSTRTQGVEFLNLSLRK